MGIDFVGAGLGVPAAHRRDRRHRAGHPGAGDRGGDPADPRHRARRAADAAGVRLPDPRPRVRPGQRRHRRPDRLRRPRGAGALGAADRRRRRRGELRPRSTPGVLYIDITLRASAAPTTRATSSSRSTSSPSTRPTELRPSHAPARRRELTMPARPEPRRPALPGPGRRRQAPGAAALPGLDRPQRLRPGRHADRGVRPDGRPADLPAQPGAGPALHQVPRADRRRAAPAGRGPRRRDVLAVGAAAADRRWSAPRPRSPRRAPTSHEPVVFSTSRELEIVPCAFAASPSSPSDGRAADRHDRRARPRRGVRLLRRRRRCPATRC